MPQAMRLAELNEADRGAFVAALGAIFEDSPWVAEQAWPECPFASVGALHQAMCEAVARAGPEAQLALLRAHPELGSRRPLTASSQQEQRGAGLLDAGESVAEALARRNRSYRERFGFPYIVAVKGMSPEAILADLEARLANSAETEFETALRQVYRIARFRLDDLLDEN